MKTISLKKVSAVAVASLGFGLLSVVPASAATVTPVWTITDANATATANAVTAAGELPVAAGSPVVISLKMDQTATTAAVTLTTTFVLTDPNGTAVTSSAGFTSVAAPVANVGVTNVAGVYTITEAATGDAGALTMGTMTFTPTMGGLYALTSTTTGVVTGADTLGTPNELAGTTGDGAIYVSGAGAVVATSGIGTSTVGATTGGQATIRFATDAHAAAATTYNIISTGVGTIQTAVDGTAAANGAPSGIAAAADFTQGAKLLTAASVDQYDALVTTASTVAGTQTLTFTKINTTTGAPSQVSVVTITWGAAPTLSAGLSTAFLCAGAVTTCAADVTGGVQSINTAQTSAANAAASIKVTTVNSAGTSLTATQTITATVSGPGTLAFSTNNNNVNSQGRAITGVAGNNMIAIFGDGTSGTSTITISQGTTVIATKTVTFFGAVVTLTAVQNHKIASTAGATLGVGTAAPTSADIANTPAVVLTAKDALGNAVPGLTITALSSDTTVMSSGITVAGVTATPGNYNAAVTSVANTSGKTATLTFRVMSGTTVLAASAPVTYTLGGSVATVALSLDKTSYSAGSAAVATLTLKDSSGNAAFDADHTTILSGALASTLSIVKALQFNATTNTTVSSLGGVSTVAFNAPGTASTAWVISGKTGAGPTVDSAKALSVTASVTDATAALVTMIDALNAKIVALNALIAKIMKKLGVK